MLLDPLIIAFLVIGTGFFFQKKIGFDQKSAADILIYVTTPALVFFYIYSSGFSVGEFLPAIAAPFFLLAVTVAFASLAFRAIKYRGTGMLVPAAFMNSIYLALPIVLFALGEEGVHTVIIFDSVQTILFFTLGVFLAQKGSVKAGEKIKEVFRIPVIYAVILGIALNYFSVGVPRIMLDSLSMIGSATVPLALLAIGGRLATLKTGKLGVPLVAVFSRLVVGGIAGFAFVKLLGLQGTTASALLLMSVMPPAVNSYVLNEKFGNDPENAATAVVIGTVLCVVPIAVVLAVI